MQKTLCKFFTKSASPFLANVTISYSLKTLENFSMIYKITTLARNGLIHSRNYSFLFFYQSNNDKLNGKHLNKSHYGFHDNPKKKLNPYSRFSPSSIPFTLSFILNTDIYFQVASKFSRCSRNSFSSLSRIMN